MPFYSLRNLCTPNFLLTEILRVGCGPLHTVSRKNDLGTFEKLPEETPSRSYFPKTDLEKWKIFLSIWLLFSLRCPFNTRF
jgi:hypothetical protein